MPFWGGETTKRRNDKTAAPVRRPQRRGAGGRERGHDFSRGEDRSQTRARAAGKGGMIFRRGVARKQGARAVGREDRIFRRGAASPADKGRGRPGEGA